MVVPFFIPKTMALKTNALLLVPLIGGALAYRAVRAAPPKPPVITSARIRLRDGRHLAYKEFGVPKELAKNKIVFMHGFASSRHDTAIADILRPGVLEELGAYIVSFDRPGYGESDPDPNRTPKSLAFDVEELADKLQLGPKFYAIGYSMGGQAVWGLLKYIPHRLAGATLMTPVTNYWWSGFPSKLSKMAYSKQPRQDQWAVGVAHHLPWLTYWWMTQKWFPGSSVLSQNPAILSQQDLSLLFSPNVPPRPYQSQVLQQGESESVCRDMIVGFGNWDFDPFEIENPFPNNEGQVHLWQGEEDKLVPTMLQRYIGQNIPWIKYHELPGSGHMFPLMAEVNEAILRTQLEREKE
ncbi:uncharacterized protein LOC107628118 [Arachis ipaensis]|uniref:AB hydrolase-1 domain-containing protein n=2 Tax=Arachis hypogaea TaxID=3818 RepID=A0A445AC27_ARAHY|nr:uncharacterized protein LOC107628118 [Arachis ipaensis]QHO22370.1 uncharacterized protein DS421_12g354660 [Arachis hypogaea]RYR23959.1 hypothetical protein Ahy_B02g057444 [Arachis hypogaea]